MKTTTLTPLWLPSVYKHMQIFHNEVNEISWLDWLIKSAPLSDSSELLT